MSEQVTEPLAIAPGTTPRGERLLARVRWLDHYRRAVAVAVAAAAVVSPLAVARVARN